MLFKKRRFLFNAVDPMQKILQDQKINFNFEDNQEPYNTQTQTSENLF
jgi:hypothetical protein